MQFHFGPKQNYIWISSAAKIVLTFTLFLGSYDYPSVTRFHGFVAVDVTMAVGIHVKVTEKFYLKSAMVGPEDFSLSDKVH